MKDSFKTTANNTAATSCKIVIGDVIAHNTLSADEVQQLMSQESKLVMEPPVEIMN